MKDIKRAPASNCSGSIGFLLKGAEKRRSMARAKARLIQGEQGITPRLAAVK